MAVVVLIVIIGVIIVIVKKVQEEKKNANEEEKYEETLSAIIYYGDEFEHKESIKITNHIVSTILVYEENTNMWICPLCETENLLSKQSCCICHYSRKEGV